MSYERVDLDELKKLMQGSLSISEVHERYSGFVNKKGTMSVCPFCYKDSLYETKGNTLKCYAKSGCNGQSYDIFGYYMEKFGVSFYVALIKLAQDFGYIKDDIAERILSKTYTGTSVRVNREVVEQKKKVLEEVNKYAKHQSPQVINDVYEALAKLSKIKEYEKLHLLNFRDLSEDRIERDYFTMPYMYGDAGYEFMGKLKAYIYSEYGYTEDMLIGVPGFYRDENDKITFISRKGIGMKARNASGMVNGLQIRNYDFINATGKLYLGEDKSKYTWVSSRKLKDGCPTNACVDVIIPDGDMYTTVFITEGKYKSEIISRKFKCPVIAVPGVTQWRSVVTSEMEYIDANIRKVNNIYLSYDADMGTNLNVYREFKLMAEELLEKSTATLKVVVWSETFGKGLDDVILSNNADKIKKILYPDYIEKYEAYLKELKKRYTIDGSAIYYSNTEDEVDKGELYELYSEMVLEPLGVAV